MLTEAPVAPSTTAGKLAGRLGPVQLAGIETALASIYPRWLALAPAAVRAWLVLRDPTIDPAGLLARPSMSDGRLKVSRLCLSRTGGH